MKQFYIYIFLLISFIGKAQNITILDADTHQPIAHVAVFNENGTKSVISNTKGQVDIVPFLI